jgi:hypothetical protein
MTRGTFSLLEPRGMAMSLIGAMGIESREDLKSLIDELQSVFTLKSLALAIFHIPTRLFARCKSFFIRLS